MLYYRDYLYVPSELLTLRTQILRINYDLPSAGHSSRNYTFDLVTRNYYQLLIREDIERFVAYCYIYIRTKPSRQSKASLLRPLSVLTQRQQYITIDYVTGLPAASNGDYAYDAVLVVVDRLTKIRHLIPIVNGDNGTNAAYTTDTFIDNVQKLYSLPKTITSNYRLQFISDFQIYLYRRLNINIRLLTARYPQTDSQTKRFNSTIEAYLRAFVTYVRDDQKDQLSIAEFAANNATNDLLGMLPFFAYYSYNPRIGIEPLRNNDDSIPTSKDAAAQLTQLQLVNDYAV